MSTQHKVKSWTQFYKPIVTGDKTHDLRHDDRDFKVGDTMILQEFEPFGGGYTGEETEVEITFITSRSTPCAFSLAVLDREYVILSIRLKHGEPT